MHVFAIFDAFLTGAYIGGVKLPALPTAAILNEIVAVITARFAFQWAGEIQKPSDKRLP